MDHDYVDVAGTYKYHTVSALLIEVGEDDNRWIPRSLLDLEDVDLDDLSDGQMATFRVRAWWAQREGLI